MNSPPATQRGQDATSGRAFDLRSKRPFVLHVITGLNVGGAERMLVKLLQHAQASSLSLRQEAVTLLPPGPAAFDLEGAKTPVYSLNMRAGVPSLGALARLRRLIGRLKPDVLVGWMHHAFFSASLAQLGRAGPPVIWNVRHSLHDLQREKPLTRAVLRACAGMSGAPAAIAFNAAASKAQYRAFGFRNDRMIVIENGFDTGRFRPRPEARALLEKNFGVSPDDLVIASIARPHPMKDPFTLIDAVGRLRRRGFAARLLLAGEGYDDPPADIRAALDAAFPPRTAILSGHRADIADWLSGVDIFALSSAWGEGFPNVLGEALASGVPCVATDVGDSAAIVGAGGRIAPPGDPAAFSDALADLARLDREGRRRLGAAGRDRVIRHYAIDRIVERYSDLYREVLLDAAAAGAADGAAGAASGRC